MSVTDGTVLRIVVTMVWTDGNICQNVYNAVVTGGGAPWDPADITDDAELWADDMYLNIAAHMSDELDGSTVTVYEYDAVDDDWDEVGVVAWVYNFTNATDELPRGTAGLVNFKTTDPDVSGKKYVPGFCESSIDGGLLNAGVLTAIGNYALDVMTPYVGGVSGATWTPGVWSVVGTVFKAFNLSAITSNVMAYQRRRKRGVGV